MVKGKEILYAMVMLQC